MNTNFFCLPGCGHLKDGVYRLSCGNAASGCPIKKAPEVRAHIARMWPVEGRADRLLKNRLRRNPRGRGNVCGDGGGGGMMGFGWGML